MNRWFYCQLRTNIYNNWYKTFYVRVVILSTQSSAKLLEQLKSAFKRTFDWKKYESKVTVEQQNRHLDFLIRPSFQGINRPFLLSFEKNGDRASYAIHYFG